MMIEGWCWVYMAKPAHTAAHKQCCKEMSIQHNWHLSVGCCMVVATASFCSPQLSLLT